MTAVTPVDLRFQCQDLDLKVHDEQRVGEVFRSKSHACASQGIPLKYDELAAPQTEHDFDRLLSAEGREIEDIRRVQVASDLLKLNIANLYLLSLTTACNFYSFDLACGVAHESMPFIVVTLGIHMSIKLYAIPLHIEFAQPTGSRH